MEHLNVCQPCFEAMREFGAFEWIGLGVLAALTVVSIFTKKNFISMAGSIIQAGKAVSDKIRNK